MIKISINPHDNYDKFIDESEIAFKISRKNKWQKEKYYRHIYIPFNDPELIKQNVEVWAVTYFDHAIRNKMIFVKGDRKYTIECIHPNIIEFLYDDENEILYQKDPTLEEKQKNQKILGMYRSFDYFFTIKAFVEYLVNYGFLRCIKDSFMWPDTTIIESRNRMQILDVLSRIIPKQCKELLFWYLDELKECIKEYKGNDRIQHENRYTWVITNYSEAMIPTNSKRDFYLFDDHYGIENLPRKKLVKLAEKKLLKDDIIFKLLSKRDFEIHLNLYLNDNLPENERINFLKGSEFYINWKSHWKLTPKIRTEFLQENFENSKILIKFAQRPDLNSEEKETLLDNKHPKVRASLARNNNAHLSDSQLLKLAIDETYIVRYSLTKRWHLPLKVIYKLLNNSNESPEIVKKIKEKHLDYYDTKEKIIELNNPKFIKTMIKKLNYLDERFVIELLMSENEEIRELTFNKYVKNWEQLFKLAQKHRSLVNYVFRKCIGKDQRTKELFLKILKMNSKDLFTKDILDTFKDLGFSHKILIQLLPFTQLKTRLGLFYYLMKENSIEVEKNYD